jgi:hypothetical protein
MFGTKLAGGRYVPEIVWIGCCGIVGSEKVPNGVWKLKNGVGLAKVWCC